jgi:hypothetical protein
MIYEPTKPTAPTPVQSVEPWTNFPSFDDQTLLSSLYAADASKVRATGDHWGLLGRWLNEHAEDIKGAFGPVRETWIMPSANLYDKQVRGIVDSILAVATMAETLRDLLHSAADGIEAAQAMLPPPQGWAGREAMIAQG